MPNKNSTERYNYNRTLDGFFSGQTPTELYVVSQCNG